MSRGIYTAFDDFFLKESIKQGETLSSCQRGWFQNRKKREYGHADEEEPIIEWLEAWERE